MTNEDLLIRLAFMRNMLNTINHELVMIKEQLEHNHIDTKTAEKMICTVVKRFKLDKCSKQHIEELCWYCTQDDGANNPVVRGIELGIHFDPSRIAEKRTEIHTLLTEHCEAFRNGGTFLAFGNCYQIDPEHADILLCLAIGAGWAESIDGHITLFLEP